MAKISNSLGPEKAPQKERKTFAHVAAVAEGVACAEPAWQVRVVSAVSGFVDS